MPLDQPGGVVGLAAVQSRLSQFLDGLKAAHPQQVFLEGTDEPLGTAIALGRPDEGGRTLEAEEGDLLLEVVRHVLRSWSCRTARPRALALPNPPKRCRTPCRIGSRAWKRVACGCAWIPTHSAEQ